MPTHHYSPHRVAGRTQRLIRPVAVAGVTAAIAAAGCGNADPGGSERRAAPVEAAAAADAVPSASRARRLAEFRQMIVALYRIPGDGSSGGDPLDELWRNLARQYGGGLRS